MIIDGNNLTMGERMTLRQIMRAKAGEVTVKEAREHCAPTGTAFVVQVVAVTILALGMGAIFLPFLLVGLAAPVIMPLRQRSKRRRWAILLPEDRDGEKVSLA